MKNSTINILLVEDQDAFADLLRQILAHDTVSQFVVTPVSTFQEALGAVGHNVFDAALLDLTLPDREGLDTYLTLHRLVPALPVIVLTGMDDEKLALEAVRQGAQDYLVKGQFDGRMLARILRYAIERKRAAEAMRRSEEFFRLISENVTDMIAVIDRDGHRVYNSPSYQSILGNPQFLVGTNSFDEIHPEDRVRVQTLFRDTIDSGVGQRTEYRLLLPDNQVRHIESQGSVIRDETGHADKVVVVSRDITERKEAVEKLRQALGDLSQSHEDLKAAQLRVVQSEKLEAVSTFAAGVAHEVKNPLQAIILGVDFLTNYVAGNDASVKMVLGEMDQAVQRADSIVRGLMEFAAYNRGDTRDETLSTIVGQALHSVANELSVANVLLDRELQPDLPTLRLDLKTMKHVFINLFLNALRAMPQGGSLLVRTFARTIPEDNASFRLKVGDTVVGVEVHQEPKSDAEVPLEAARPSAKTAVGMTVLRKIVELHGGMIEVVERDEAGARITILFKAEKKP